MLQRPRNAARRGGVNSFIQSKFCADFGHAKSAYRPSNSNLLNDIKNGVRCGRKSLNSTESLASEDFGFPASLNSLNILCLTRRTIYSLFN